MIYIYIYIYIYIHTYAEKLKFNIDRSSENAKRITQTCYVEIKCQLDPTDDFYCRSYCLLNMFRAPLCPSSGAREYYTSGCCLSYLVLGFQVVGVVWCGTECCVSGSRAVALCLQLFPVYIWHINTLKSEDKMVICK